MANDALVSLFKMSPEPGTYSLNVPFCFLRNPFKQMITFKSVLCLEAWKQMDNLSLEHGSKGLTENKHQFKIRQETRPSRTLLVLSIHPLKKIASPYAWDSHCFLLGNNGTIRSI